MKNYYDPNYGPSAINIKGGWVRKGDKCIITSNTWKNNKGKIIKIHCFKFSFSHNSYKWDWIVSKTGNFYHKSVLKKY